VPASLLSDLRTLIDSTRAGLAQAVNSALVILYWQVGIRIRTDVLGSKRAGYGEQILPTLSAKLVPSMAKGSASATSLEWSASPKCFRTRKSS